MSTVERGTKHICPECASRYYDLKREIVVCPKCGAKPSLPRLARPRVKNTRTSRPAFRPYR